MGYYKFISTDDSKWETNLLKYPSLNGEKNL